MRKVTRGIFPTLSARYGMVVLHVFTAGIIIMLSNTKVLQADDRQKAVDLFNEGQALYDKSNLRGAAEKWEQVLDISRKINNQQGISVAVNNLSVVYQHLGDYPKALRYYEQVLEN